MSKLIDSGEIKQIIVVTDGRSDMGVSPVEAARRAYEAGVTVSTIGIINLRDSSYEKNMEEAEEIAKAGGGFCEYSHMEALGRTMLNLTHKTARRTIEHIVCKQLKLIIGEEIDCLEPKSRLRIAEFIDKYGENINLKCVIVLDTSGSIKDKPSIAIRSVIELLENLQGRKGNSSIAVIAYQGEASDMCSVICGFTSEIGMLRQKLELISFGSGTPTGSAILKACELLYQYYEVQGPDVSEECEALKYYV